MIMTLIFIVSLLIGISLFVAVVGTAFLKKHARRLNRPAVYYPGARHAGSRESGYRDPSRRNTMPGRAFYRDTVPQDTALGNDFPGDENLMDEERDARGFYPGDYQARQEDLRRPERRMAPPGDADSRGYRGYKEQFRKEFHERVNEGFDRPVKAPREAGLHPPARSLEYGTAGGPAALRSSGSWFFIIIVAIIFVIFVAFFGVKGYRNLTSKPALSFCESVDYIKQKPVNRSNTFTRGNVTIFVKSREPLGQHSARVDIYRIDQTGLEPFAGKELSIKPEWTSYSFKVLFDELGVYSVMVFDAEGVLLNQKRVYIVHDSYAYKPVSR
jgi:hypothetical protein